MLSLLNTELKSPDAVIMHSHENIGKSAVTGRPDALMWGRVVVMDFLSIHKVFQMTPWVKVECCEVKESGCPFQ